MPRPGAVVRRAGPLLARAKHIRETDGWTALLKRAVSFVGYCLFEHRSYWLYAEPIAAHPELNEADFLPSSDRFTFKIVTSNEEADQMEAEGLEFRSRAPNGRERLDMGAVALCLFHGHELASMNWVAMSQPAKDSLNEPPCTVDFARREAWAGGNWTDPRYRRMGLSAYRFFLTRQFLREHGVSVKRNAFRRGGGGPEGPAGRIDRTMYAEGRYRRILWWSSWKERPLAGGEECRNQEL